MSLFLTSSVRFIFVVLSYIVLSSAQENVLQLNGQTSYVEIQDFDPLDKGLFTLTAWVWCERESDELEAIMGVATSNAKYTMTLGWGSGRFYYSDGIKEAPVFGNNTYERHVWHHIALTMESEERDQYFDSGRNVASHRKGRIYVDGNLEVSFQTRVFDLTRPTLIAGAEYKQYAKVSHFSGLMDELRAYSTKLRQEQVAMLAFTTDELGDYGIVFRASFEDLPAGSGGKVVQTQNLAGGGTVHVAYSDKERVKLTMPYNKLALAQPSRPSRYTTEPGDSGNQGPFIGSNISVTGGIFSDSRFFSAEMDDGETRHQLNYSITDNGQMSILMPPMEYNGQPKNVSVSISNGGQNEQSFEFVYTYTLGEDWEHELRAIYMFDRASWNGTTHTWDSIVDRDSAAWRARKVANYGMGGPVLAPDRNGITDGAIAFSLGERVELPPLNSTWSVCLWIYARERTDVFFQEQDARGRSARSTLKLSPEGELSLDGFSGGARVRLQSWQFVCVTRGREAASFYVSGRPSGSTDLPPHSAAAPRMHHALLGRTLDGLVDNMWVWGRELHAHEVQSMYSDGDPSVTLDGAPDSYFQLESSPGVLDVQALVNGTDTFTVQMWVRPDDDRGVQPIFQIPAEPHSTVTEQTDVIAISHGFFVGIINGSVLATVALSSDFVLDGATHWGSAITSSTSAAPAGVWTNIAVVYTDRRLRIFTNGTQQPLHPATQGPGSGLGSFFANTQVSATMSSPGDTEQFSHGMHTSPNSEPARFGSAKSQSQQSGEQVGTFKGSVAELFLWNSALNATEVSNSIANTPMPRSEGLLAAFPFDEGVSRVARSIASSLFRLALSYVSQRYPLWKFAIRAAQSFITYWPLSEFSGSSTRVATAGVQASFTFQTRNIRGRLKIIGGDNVQFLLVGPLDRHTMAHFGVCKDNMDGTYSCTYNVTMCGYYSLRLEEGSVPVEPGDYSFWDERGSVLTLGAQGLEQGFIRNSRYAHLMAKGTPGKIYVHPGPTWAPKSYVWDDPDWLPASDLEEAHKAVPASFLLQAVDFWGCPRTTGGDEWEVRIDGRFSQEGSTTDYRNGTYLVTYVGHIVGHTNMSVTLNGRHANTDTEADPHAVCSWSLASDPNGSPWCVDIRPGQGSLEFDGVNYVSVPHDDRLSFGEHWSLDVWVHPRDRTDAAGRIISKQSARSGQGHWIGFVDGGNIEVGLYVGGDDFRTLRTGYEVQPGHWTHIAVAYTGDSIRVYINGGLSESKTFDRSTPIRDNNQPMVIGRGFVGLIDELRVFREDMTSQLESLWKCPAFPELLAAYFSFNDGPGATEAHDYFGLRGALMGFNASGNRTVPDPHFFPAWRDIHAKSNYGVVDFEASRSKSFTETGFTEAVAGLDSTFTFKFWDMCGFEYVSENVEVEAMMVEDVYRNDRHDQISYPIENLTVVRQLSTTTKTAACYRSSEFRVDYTPPTCGTLRISIRLDGNMVPGFPTEIPVAPQRVPNATMSSITGVNDAVAGLETSFSIIARDRFGCQRSSGGDEFEVLMTRTTLGQNPEGIVFAGPDVVTLELSPQDQGDGTYTVPYTAPAEGNYTFYVGLVEPDDTRSYLQGEDRQPVRFVAAPPPWREVQVDGSIPDPRYRATAAKSDKYAFVFRGWSTDKEGLMDVWRYPLANQENWVYRTTVTVHNLPSHAVRIDVDTRLLIAQGKMRDDCGDVMFKAQSASEWEDPSIPYWIDPYYRCDTPSTAFWLAPPSADLYMFYGNPRARMPQEDPSRLFVVWEDFNSIDRSTELPTGWQFEGTCSLRPGDPSTFSVGHEAIRPWHGEAALQVDAISRLGGALYRKLEVPPLDQYTLRAAFYDSDAPASSHWISPNYDDCRNVPNAKEMLNQKSGLGVFTASIEEEYTALYPWRSVEDNRTAGWHLLEITSDGEHVHLYIDDVLHMTQPALAPMDRIFIRGGGQDPDVPLESLAAWDAILVARRDNATSVSFGKEEALIYTSKRFHQVSTRGTPPPPRTAAAAAVYDNKVYLLGGYGTYGTYADSGASRGATSRPEADNLVWTFDLTSETFRWMMPWGTARPSPRFEHAVAVQEETATIYFFGGRSADKGVLLSDLWAFYIGDDAWEEIQADCGPSPRFLTASVVYKHLFIVFGGLVNSDHQPGRELVSQPTNELWAFDTVERKWSDMTPKRSPAPRYAHAATMQNGQMYIYGGYDNRHHFADVHKYDIDYNRWTMLKPDTRYDTPAEKTSLAAIAHDDKLMIFGGLEETPASYTNDMWTICIY